MEAIITIKLLIHFCGYTSAYYPHLNTSHIFLINTLIKIIFQFIFIYRSQFLEKSSFYREPHWHQS